jgi:hypothetical protein
VAERCRRKSKLYDWLCRALLVVALVASCGPPLTEPSPLDVSGHWMTSDSVGVLSDLEVTITQRRDGTLSGQWSGKAPANAVCPPDLGLNPTGPVSGINTVLEVRLAVLGAGDFDGQMVDSQTLKGTFDSCGVGYSIVFALMGPVPPP